MPDPVFIVAAPRSGAALLAEALTQGRHAVDASDRLNAIIRAQCGERERLAAADATEAVAGALRGALAASSGVSRWIDATADNARRVPFLHAVFPGAMFVYIYREPRRAVLDLRASDGKPLDEAARAWSDATTTLLDDLERLPPGSWTVVAYRDLVDDPMKTVARVADHLDIPWNGKLMPQPKRLEPPPPEIAADLDAVDEITRGIAERARDFFAAPPPRAGRPRGKAKEVVEQADAAPFRSVATQSFPALLKRLGITLAVSTYQSGRVIFLRADSPTSLNTHFRMFRSPMGIAVGQGRMAIGTDREIWDFRNMPALTPKIEPPGKHDACFVPRKVHVTGDIRIHEVGYASGELWIVNTRFSALCTLDADSSFVPRWRPPFITRLAAEDRCHLNGMTIIDQRIRFVTALGTTDVAGGWREKKASGGVLLDVDSGEVALRGLSMPHSPRQYNGRFFILESGKGTLATADLTNGHIETIAQLPGFTRGLAFAGPYAFIGLSQVRESNIFGGIPLTERVAERECGVYAVDIRSGQIVAFLRFEGDVREIFDVQVLYGMHYPELLELGAPLVATSYSVPDEMLQQFTPA